MRTGFMAALGVVVLGLTGVGVSSQAIRPQAVIPGPVVQTPAGHGSEGWVDLLTSGSRHLVAEAQRVIDEDWSGLDHSAVPERLADLAVDGLFDKSRLSDGLPSVPGQPLPSSLVPRKPLRLRDLIVVLPWTPVWF